MKKAIIICHSKTGRTRRYAEEIEEYLEGKQIQVSIVSIQGFKESLLQGVDFVMFGCWTSGLLFFFQHPDKQWRVFAAKLPTIQGVKLGLFTTYKILTGSMFGKMYAELKHKTSEPSMLLKSRNTHLSETDKIALNEFVR